MTEPRDRDRTGLVRRAQKGDEIAFASLVAEIDRRLYSTALLILRDAAAAEDAVQEALVDMWRNLPRLREPDRFDGWAYRIVVHAAYAESRRRKRTRWTTDVTDVGDPPTPDAAAGLADRDQLERGFRALPVDHRAVLVLKHYLGLADREIAEALDVPEGTIRSRLHYGMRALRAALQADEREAGE